MWERLSSSHSVPAIFTATNSSKSSGRSPADHAYAAVRQSAGPCIVRLRGTGDRGPLIYFRLSAPASSRASWMTARLCTPVITSPAGSFTETSKAYSFPSRPV